VVRRAACDVRVLGLVPSRQRRQLAFRIGTVFGQRSQLWYQLPPRDTFALLGRVYEIDRREHARRVATLSAIFGLDRLAGPPVRQLSRGGGRRGGMAGGAAPRRRRRACCPPRASFSSTSRRSASISPPRPRSAICCGRNRWPRA